MRWIFLAWLIAAAPAWAAPKTPAVDDEKKSAAKRFFDTGTLLFERGEFIDAAKNFERAYGELFTGETVDRAIASWREVSAAAIAGRTSG